MAVGLLVAAVACGGGGGPRPAAAPPTTATSSSRAALVDPAPPVTEAPTTTVAPAAPDPATAHADDPGLAGARPAAPARPAGAPAPIGRIEIPGIGLDHAIFEGIDLSILNHGPGHWPGTALPGESGNTVFPGHRTTYSRPFWDIDRLAAGDLVIFTTSAGRFTYRVAETLVVPADAMWIANPTPGPTMTIFGCHPKGSARYRYVARGPLVGTKGPVELARPAPSPGSSGPGPSPGPAPGDPPPPSTTSTTQPPAIDVPCLLCLAGK